MGVQNEGLNPRSGRRESGVVWAPAGRYLAIRFPQGGCKRGSKFLDGRNFLTAMLADEQMILNFFLLGWS